ncbi:MAG TPA: PDZ domain-containing protein [Pyrinomonadaceae bacterium]|jgi:serine protease Do
MIPKKLLLFSASLLLFVSVNTHAQQATAATPAAQADSSPSVSLFTSGGNYLGIAVAEVTRENMGRYSLREPRGIVITKVFEDSPAARAGLRAGDVILRFDGEQVSTYSKLQRLISEAAPEQTVRLSISRNGTEQEVSVTMGRRKNSFQDLITVYPTQPQTAEATRALEQLQRGQGAIGFGFGRRIGVNTTQLTKQLADYFGVTGGKGLLVTSVAENSPAARAGLKAGDVITDVDGEKVESAGDLSRAINRKADGTVTLKIVRDRNSTTLTVTPEKRESGAISISPELFEINPGAFEFSLPTIDIRLPQIKPIKIPAIKFPQIKIKPEQLRQLQKLESLNLESLMLL